MKKSLLFTLLLTIPFLTFAQSQKKTVAWLEAKLPLYLEKSAPVSNNTQGGEIKEGEGSEIKIKNECSLQVRVKGDKSSGYTLSLGKVITIEITDENTLTLVTEEEGVSFVGVYEDKPKKTQMIYVSSVEMTFKTEEQTENAKAALEQLAEKCGAKLVKDDLFDD